MKRLSLWELGKGWLVATLGLSLGALALGTAAGWPLADSLTLAGWLAGFVGLLAGVGGMGYALAQLSAGAELAGHNFGATVGSAVGAFEAARLAARGELPAPAVAGAQAQLLTATDRANALRDTHGPDGADLVSRFKLANALTNTVIRWHAGKRISRKAMADDGVVDQRYWNLATHVLIQLGLRDPNSSAWRTQGAESLDLAWVASRVKVVAHSQVWVLPENASSWTRIDLGRCHFLNLAAPPEPEPDPALVLLGQGTD